eukprot:COSAG01_NODE_651_length_14494_cov_37.478119_7_plen_407_part_00
MPVLWEPHYDAMWQMFAGQRRSPGDKRKAYTVAGAFWTDTVLPFVTDPANKTIFERASVTKRAQWLGQLLHELGWRNTGEVDFVPEKDIENLPVLDFDVDAVNWRKNVAQWRSIVPELSEPVHSFLLLISQDVGFADAFFRATGMPLLDPNLAGAGGGVAGAAGAVPPPGAGVPPPGAAGGPATELTISAESLAALQANTHRAGQDQQTAARMTAAQSTATMDAVSRGDIVDPFKLRDCLNTEESKALLEDADMEAPGDLSAKDTDDYHGTMGTKVLSLDPSQPGYKQVQQSILFGKNTGCEVSHDPAIIKLNCMHEGVVQVLAGKFSEWCANSRISWTDVVKMFNTVAPHTACAPPMAGECAFTRVDLGPTRDTLSRVEYLHKRYHITHDEIVSSHNSSLLQRKL